MKVKVPVGICFLWLLLCYELVADGEQKRKEQAKYNVSITSYGTILMRRK